MSDVIDDDLMRELGLDADDLKVIEDKKKTSANKPSVAASTSLDDLDLDLDEPVAPVAKPAAPRAQPPVKAPTPTPSAHAVAKTPAQPSMTDFNESLAKDVPVQLAAVLAKKTLNLGQILELRVGEVLDLSRKPSDPIDLVANGKLVAKAELVMIDGQIGVRIIKLMR